MQLLRACALQTVVQVQWVQILCEEDASHQDFDRCQILLYVANILVLVWYCIFYFVFHLKKKILHLNKICLLLLLL